MQQTTNTDYPSHATCLALKAAGWDQTIATKFYNGRGGLYHPPSASWFPDVTAAPSLAQLLGWLSERGCTPGIWAGWRCAIRLDNRMSWHDGPTPVEAAAAAVLHILRSADKTTHVEQLRSESTEPRDFIGVDVGAQDVVVSAITLDAAGRMAAMLDSQPAIPVQIVVSETMPPGAAVLKNRDGDAVLAAARCAELDPPPVSADATNDLLCEGCGERPATAVDDEGVNLCADCAATCVATHETPVDESQAALRSADESQPYPFAKGVDLTGGLCMTQDGELVTINERDRLLWVSAECLRGCRHWTTDYLRPAPHDWQVGDTARVVSTAAYDKTMRANGYTDYVLPPVGFCGQIAVSELAPAAELGLLKISPGPLKDPYYSHPADLLYIPPTETPIRDLQPATPVTDPPPMRYPAGRRVVCGNTLGRVVSAEWRVNGVGVGEWLYTIMLPNGAMTDGVWRESKLRSLKDALPKGGK